MLHLQNFKLPEPKLTIVEERNTGLKYEGIHQVAIIDMKASKLRVLQDNEDDNLEEKLDELRRKRFMGEPKPSKSNSIPRAAYYSPPPEKDFKMAMQKKYHKVYEFTPIASGLILNRLERLMGSDKIRINDLRYFRAFNRKLEGEEGQVFRLIVERRAKKERDRYRTHVLAGEMEPTADMDASILENPIFKVNQRLNRNERAMLAYAENTYGYDVQDTLGIVPEPVVPMDFDKPVEQLFRETIKKYKLHVPVRIMSEYRDDSDSSGSVTPEEFKHLSWKRRKSSIEVIAAQLRRKALDRHREELKEAGIVPKKRLSEEKPVTLQLHKKKKYQPHHHMEFNSFGKDKFDCTYKYVGKSKRSLGKNVEDTTSLDSSLKSQVQFDGYRFKRPPETPLERWRRIVYQFSGEESEEEESTDEEVLMRRKKYSSAAAPAKTVSQTSSEKRKGRQSRALEISQDATKEFGRIQRRIRREQKRAKIEAANRSLGLETKTTVPVDDEEMKRREAEKQNDQDKETEEKNIDEDEDNGEGEDENQDENEEEEEKEVEVIKGKFKWNKKDKKEKKEKKEKEKSKKTKSPKSQKSKSPKTQKSKSPKKKKGKPEPEPEPEPELEPEQELEPEPEQEQEE